MLITLLFRYHVIFSSSEFGSVWTMIPSTILPIYGEDDLQILRIFPAGSCRTVQNPAKKQGKGRCCETIKRISYLHILLIIVRDYSYIFINNVYYSDKSES